MPFTAQCPNCRSARFTVPFKKRDETMACPKCEREFVLIPDDEPPDRSRMRGRAIEPEPYKPSVVNAPVATFEADDSDEPKRTPVDAPTAVALVALTLVGVGVILGQIPYGRFAAVGLAPLGALAAGVSLFSLERRRWLGWAGVGANAVVFLLTLLAPSWLGVSSWLPPADPNENVNAVVSVGKDGTPPIPAEWVDASLAAWQQADVRIEITSVRNGPLEPNAKSAERRKVRGLKIDLQLSNVGVARAIECGPSAEPPSEPKLTTANGQPIPWKQAEGSFKPAKVFPGKSTEFSFVFDVPAEPSGDLRLELPAAWFGNADAVKLRIPTATIGRR